MSGADIRDDIARTRAEMTRTVDAIEERLSPAHIKEQIADVKENVLAQLQDAKDNLKEDLKGEIREAKSAVREATVGRVENMVHDVRESVSETGTSIVDTIRENPIPAAMIAVGLGWLVMGGGGSRRRTVRRTSAPRVIYGGAYDPRYQYERERRVGGPRRVVREAIGSVQDGANEVGQRVAEVGQRVQEGAEHLVDEAGHVAHDLGERAAHFADDAADTGRRVIRGAGRNARRAEASLESTLQDNPLVLGAIAVAIGAAIGLALPSTDKEDELMGEAKDRLLEGAKGVAGEALHTVEEKVDAIGTGGTGENESPRNGISGPSSSPNGFSGANHV